jgi:hypothetical protein
MMIKARVKSGISTLALCAATAALGGGCADISMPTMATPATASATAPAVQECAMLGPGTPTKYVCGGKVYTSYQLAKLRQDEIKKYESGK